MRIKKGWPALHDSFEKHHEMAGFFFLTYCFIRCKNKELKPLSLYF